SHTQLSGSLLQTLSGWKEILSFYYVVRLLLLLLPVSLLLPLLIVWNRRKFGKPGGVERLLLYVSVTTLAVFTAGGHYRPHYMLPLLPVFTFLLAAWISRSEGHSIPKKIWRILFGIGLAVLAVCAGLLLWQRQYITVILLAGAGTALVFLVRKEVNEPVWRDRPLFVQLIAAALLFVLLFAGFNELPLRNKTRGQDRDFAVTVGQKVSTGDQLTAWSEFPDILPYYARHQVVLINDLNELKTRFPPAGDGQNVFMIIPKNVLPVLNGTFDVSLLATKENKRKPGKTLVFVKLLRVP
ncbi:MAG: hypothetical protein WC334_08455, partial [Kiritimatiellales bacterium]